MRTIIFSSLLLIFSVNVLTAQDSLATSNFIEDEFDNLIESSNNYQGYKVVDYDALIELRDNTKRHVQDLKNELQEEEGVWAALHHRLGVLAIGEAAVIGVSLLDYLTGHIYFIILVAHFGWGTFA